MLSMLEVRNLAGDLLQFPFGDITDGFSVEDITGLDPVKASIVSSSFANQDGEQYHSARRDKRNIVIKLGLEPDYTTQSARQLRNRLYNYFMTKAEVFMRFYSDDGEPTVRIAGRVESFDCPLFTRDPVATISVICVRPDFFDPTVNTISGNSVSTATEQLVTYAGTVETGFTFKLNINRTVTQLTVNNRTSDATPRKMDITANLQSGDLLEISTVSGSKGVWVTRAGVRSSILYALSPFADWLQLYPGKNYLRVYVDGAAIPFTIDYTNKYGGL